jgi:hypothetical protein
MREHPKEDHMTRRILLTLAAVALTATTAREVEIGRPRG